jgi:hypothetical protein
MKLLSHKKKLKTKNNDDIWTSVKPYPEAGWVAAGRRTAYSASEMPRYFLTGSEAANRRYFNNKMVRNKRLNAEIFNY